MNEGALALVAFALIVRVRAEVGSTGGCKGRQT
jgi:hypothetical protein